MPEGYEPRGAQHVGACNVFHRAHGCVRRRWWGALCFLWAICRVGVGSTSGAGLRASSRRRGRRGVACRARGAVGVRGVFRCGGGGGDNLRQSLEEEFVGLLRVRGLGGVVGDVVRELDDAGSRAFRGQGNDAVLLVAVGFPPILRARLRRELVAIHGPAVPVLGAHLVKEGCVRVGFWAPGDVAVLVREGVAEAACVEGLSRLVRPLRQRQCPQAVARGAAVVAGAVERLHAVLVEGLLGSDHLAVGCGARVIVASVGGPPAGWPGAARLRPFVTLGHPRAMATGIRRSSAPAGGVHAVDAQGCPWRSGAGSTVGIVATVAPFAVGGIVEVQALVQDARHALAEVVVPSLGAAARPAGICKHGSLHILTRLVHHGGGSVAHAHRVCVDAAAPLGVFVSYHGVVDPVGVDPHGVVEEDGARVEEVDDYLGHGLDCLVRGGPGFGIPGSGCCAHTHHRVLAERDGAHLRLDEGVRAQNAVELGPPRFARAL
mmetsp:Transcript_5316/g.15761  ORF Transcript_5316/g.15761 Transcript_5316/m.15761 type:complete len:490 (+) Transcript_5316:2046-3515(+)